MRLDHAASSFAVSRILRRAALVPLFLALLAAPVHAKEGAEAPKPKAEEPVERPAVEIWSDQTVLDKHLSAACDAVEGLCGAMFKQRPTVRVASPEEMAVVLRKELSALPEGALDGADPATLAEAISAALAAKYALETHEILVAPATLEVIADLQPSQSALGEDHLRVLLVHEATHALDFERFRWREERARRDTGESLLALGAVSEGHAQLVAQEVARTWGIEPAFDRLTHAIVGLPEHLPAAAKDMLLAQHAEIVFAYKHGLAFMRAVHDARGREGLDAVLAAPPSDTRVIESPERWLAPSDAEDEPDLEQVLSVFEVLAPEPRWTRNRMRARESTLRTQVSRYPEDRRAEFLRGFKDGRMLVGQVLGEPAQLLAVAFLFATPEDAALFVELERLGVEGAPATAAAMGLEVETAYLEAREEGLPGFAMGRTVSGAALPVALRVDLQTVHVGSVVLQVQLMNPGTRDRDVVDQVLARAHAWLLDAEAAAALPPLEIPVWSSGIPTLPVVVRDHEGALVPKATLLMSIEDGPITRHARASLAAGRGALPRSEGGKQIIYVIQPTDEGGEALPLAPVRHVVPDDHEGELALVLGPALSIRGRVVTPSGEPAANHVVVASPVYPGHAAPPALQHAQAATGDDGQFQLNGLGSLGYRLEVLTTDGGVPIAHAQAQAGATDVEIVLSERRDVEVTVVDAEGAPVHRARVQASDFASSGSSRVATTAIDGVARLEGLDPGTEYFLNVEGPRRGSEGYVSHRQGSWTPTATTVVLEAGWYLRAQVRDAQGAPARGVVHVAWPGNSHSSTTDPEGGAEIGGLPRVPVRVLAFAADLGDSIPHHHLGEIVQREGARMNPTDAPIDLVIHELGEGSWVSVDFGHIAGPPPTQLKVIQTWRHKGRTSSGMRELDGTTLRILISDFPCELTLQELRGADGEPLGFMPWTATVHASGTRLTPDLVRGRVVSGSLRSAEGTVLRGTRITAYRDDLGPHTASDATATTDAEGRFVLKGLRSDQAYLLRVEPPGSHPATEGLELAADASQIDLRLPAPHRLRVLDPDGKPVAGAQVEIAVTITQQNGWRTTYVRPKPTSAVGTTLIAPFPPRATLKLTVRPPEGREDLRRSVQKRWKPTMTPLTLARGFTLRGRVVDAQGPARNIKVEWRTPRHPDRATQRGEAASRSGPTGRFEMRELPYLPLEVRARVRGKSDDAPDRVSPWIEVEPGTATVLLRLEDRPEGDGRDRVSEHHGDSMSEAFDTEIVDTEDVPDPEPAGAR